MAPHPGEPPIIRSPGGLVTLLRWEGAKIDPGVGLKCWGEGRESQGGDGEGEEGDTCGGCPLGSLFSPPPHTWGLRTEQEEQEAGRASEKGWQGQAGGRSQKAGVRAEWPVAPSVALGLPYLLRGLAAAPGRLGGVLSPEGLLQAPAALGGARWAPTWPGTGDSRQQSGPVEPQASGLDPFSRPTPRLELQERNFFWLFFFPFLPNFGDSHAPSDVTAFLGEGHVAP